MHLIYTCSHVKDKSEATDGLINKGHDSITFLFFQCPGVLA